MHIRQLTTLILCLLLFSIGCDNGPTSDGAAPEQAQENDSTLATGAESDGLAFTATDSDIEFTCAHTGEDPEPHTGRFQDFAGTAQMQGDSLTAIHLQIQTASIATDDAELTKHLKGADFFSVRDFPTAEFTSTRVQHRGDGQVEIEGDFTMMDVTQQLTIPANVQIVDGKLSLEATFEIDRTRFGMNYGVAKIEKQVEIRVSVQQ